LKENALWVDFQGKDIESGQEILASAISLEFTSAADFLTRFGQIAENLKDWIRPIARPFWILANMKARQS